MTESPFYRCLHSKKRYKMQTLHVGTSKMEKENFATNNTKTGHHNETNKRKQYQASKQITIKQ